MTPATLEQKVKEFVEKAKMLHTASQSILALKYATEAIGEENKAEQIAKIHEKLLTIYQELIRSLKQSNLFGGSLLIRDQNSDSEKNPLEDVITFINNMSDLTILGKEELLEILESCSKTLNKKNLYDITKNLTTDGERFHQQIVMLKDLCLLD